MSPTRFCCADTVIRVTQDTDDAAAFGLAGECSDEWGQSCLGWTRRHPFHAGARILEKVGQPAGS